MKTTLTIFALTICFIANAQSGLKKFFSPIPNQSYELTDSIETSRNEWRPIISLPAFKILESSRPDAKVDALLLTSTGGGISWQKLKKNDKSGKWESTFSFSPATILISGNLTSSNPIDISYATTVGFFNNLIMFGIGYDLGSVTGRSRVFGLVSIGINLNN